MYAPAMSRRGIEAKPRWQEVPRAVRAEAERLLDARIVRAERVFGGYAPSATFRMRLADGRAAFFKGVSAASNEFMRRALPQEERVYRDLGEAISPWAPAYLGSVKVDAWHALLLEDVGPADVPPWTEAKVRLAAREFAAFHAANEGKAFPVWVPQWRDLLAGELRSWRSRFSEAPDGTKVDLFAGTASLASGSEEEARDWLVANAPRLDAAAGRLGDADPPYTLLYLDARADNVRCSRGRLRIFDWNWVAAGPAEVDVAAFAEGITADAGPPPELFVEEYRRHRALDDGPLDASVAALAGVFARSSWQPPPPELPRVRSIQRRQVKVCLAWAARRLALPDPSWLEAVAD